MAMLVQGHRQGEFARKATLYYYFFLIFYYSKTRQMLHANSSLCYALGMHLRKILHAVPSSNQTAVRAQCCVSGVTITLQRALPET